jgi:hypothetical protein
LLPYHLAPDGTDRSGTLPFSTNILSLTGPNATEKNKQMQGNPEGMT